MYSITLDESTDNTTKPNLALMVRFIDHTGMNVICKTIGLIELTKGATAEKIFDAVWGRLVQLGLAENEINENISERETKPECVLVGCGTDGCATMLGHNKGFVGLLKVNYPHLVPVHCAAHKQALGIGDSCGEYELLNINVTKDTNSYFSQSSKRVQALNKAQEDLNMKKKLRTEAQGDTRWMTLGNSLGKIVRLYEALRNVFHEDTEGPTERLNEAFNSYGFKYWVLFSEKLINHCLNVCCAKL